MGPGSWPQEPCRRMQQGARQIATVLLHLATDGNELKSTWEMLRLCARRCLDGRRELVVRCAERMVEIPCALRSTVQPVEAYLPQKGASMDL